MTSIPSWTRSSLLSERGAVRIACHVLIVAASLWLIGSLHTSWASTAGLLFVGAVACWCVTDCGKYARAQTMKSKLDKADLLLRGHGYRYAFYEAEAGVVDSEISDALLAINVHTSRIVVTGDGYLVGEILPAASIYYTATAMGRPRPPPPKLKLVVSNDDSIK